MISKTDKISIECIHACDLVAFAAASKDAKEGTVPISMTRARAWAANPYAQPDDTLLLVAKLGERCVGYLGLLPARVRITVSGEGEALDVTEPICVTSAYYVQDEARHTGAGALLLMRALSLDRTLVVTGPSEEAQRIYKAIGFTSPQSTVYYQADFMQSRKLLSLPLRLLRRVCREIPLLSKIDFDGMIGSVGTMLCCGTAILMRLRGGKCWKRWTARPASLSDVPEPSADSGYIGFVRDREWLEWLLNHPWVTTNPAEDTPGYFFNDKRDQFEHQLLEIVDKQTGQVVGSLIVWLNARPNRREIHILDMWFYGSGLSEAERAEALLATIMGQALQCRASQVFVSDSCQLAIANLGRLGQVFQQRQRMSFYYPLPKSRFKTESDRVQVRYADGDVGFA